MDKFGRDLPWALGADYGGNGFRRFSDFLGAGNGVFAVRSSEKRMGKIKGRLKPCDYGVSETFFKLL